MSIDLPTLITLAALGVAVVGLLLDAFRTRIRLRELERETREYAEFMGELRKLVAVGEKGLRVQESQTAVVQQAVLRRQSAQDRATSIQEQQAAHQRLMNWIGVGLSVYDRYRARQRDADDEDDDD